MIAAIFIFPVAIGLSALWIAFDQFHRARRQILGGLLYLFGGITSVSFLAMIPLAIINGFYGTSGEQFDWGPFGSILWLLLLLSFYAAIFSFGMLLITPIWILLSKKFKRQAQQDAAANP